MSFKKKTELDSQWADELLEIQGLDTLSIQDAARDAYRPPVDCDNCGEPSYGARFCNHCLLVGIE